MLTPIGLQLIHSSQNYTEYPWRRTTFEELCRHHAGIGNRLPFSWSRFVDVNFRAKELFGAVGNIVDGAVAYIDLNGGGPTELHTHEHNHLFIVTEGEAKILLEQHQRCNEMQLFASKSRLTDKNI